METTYTIEALYKFYLAGYELGFEGLETKAFEPASNDAREAFEVGVIHGKRNPQPPNFPVTFNMFSQFFPNGMLRDYGTGAAKTV